AGAVSLGREVRCPALESRRAEAESRLPSSSLRVLLSGGSHDQFQALPAAQHQALEAALLRGGTTGPTVDRRSVCMAVLGVLRSLSAQGPLLIAIDDWQWVDPPSLHALRFALRRIRPHQVGAVLTLRTGNSFDLGRELMEDQLEHVELGPLSLAALHQLLAERLDLWLPRPALVRLERTSGGNPLFALEIGRAIGRSGSLPEAGEPLPVPDSLREAVAERLAGLPPAARRARLFLAVSGRPTPTLL